MVSILACAKNADANARFSGTYVQKIFSDETKTWSRISSAIAHQQESTSQREKTGLLKEKADVELEKENLAEALAEAESRMIQLRAERDATLVRNQTLERKLEVAEGQCSLLKKDRSGLTSELTASQNTIRRLYKELQLHKAMKLNPPTAARAQAPKLIPQQWASNPEPQSPRELIMIKDPVVPMVERQLPPSSEGDSSATPTVIVMVDDMDEGPIAPKATTKTGGRKRSAKVGVLDRKKAARS